MAAHSFHVHFGVVFNNFYAIYKNFVHNLSISKILAAALERTTIWVKLPRLYALRPSRTHYEFMILFDFHAPSVKSLTGNDAILVSGYLSG